MKKSKTKPNEEFVKNLAKKIADYALSNSHANKKAQHHPKWYAGITYDANIREVGHKSKRNVDELPHFKNWYAYTYANARAVEKLLCSEYGMSHCKNEGNTNKDDHERPSNRVYTYKIPDNK